MYGVSKINIEPSLMMISVQDVEFKGNSQIGRASCRERV